MRAGRQPCRHPPFGALNQFIGECGYCITAVARTAAHFGSVESESDARLLAIDTEVASRWRACFSA
jgi:hypothetical protein